MYIFLYWSIVFVAKNLAESQSPQTIAAVMLQKREKHEDNNKDSSLSGYSGTGNRRRSLGCANGGRGYDEAAIRDPAGASQL